MTLRFGGSVGLTLVGLMMRPMTVDTSLERLRFGLLRRRSPSRSGSSWMDSVKECRSDGMTVLFERTCPVTNTADGLCCTPEMGRVAVRFGLFSVEGEKCAEEGDCQTFTANCERPSHPQTSTTYSGAVGNASTKTTLGCKQRRKVKYEDSK